MKVTNYDPVYRLEGRLIDFAGSLALVQVRYRILKVVGYTFLAAEIAIRLSVPTRLNAGWSLAYALAFGILAGCLFGMTLTPEFDFRGWWQTQLAEWDEWRLHRARSRVPQPATFRLDRIRVTPAHPDAGASWPGGDPVGDDTTEVAA